jgi:hypothetical protein
VFFAYDKSKRRLVAAASPFQFADQCDRDDVEAGMWLFFSKTGALLDARYVGEDEPRGPASEVDVPLLTEAPRNVLFSLRTWLPEVDVVEGFPLRNVREVRYYIDFQLWYQRGYRGDPPEIRNDPGNTMARLNEGGFRGDPSDPT